VPFEQFAILYPSMVGLLVSAGCVLAETMNAAAPGTPDRGFFVPTLSDGAYKLVHLRASADTALVSAVNNALDEKAPATERLDLEKFKKTRVIQSAALTRPAVIGLRRHRS
jgi:flavin-binding protein dodecin